MQRRCRRPLAVSAAGDAMKHGSITVIRNIGRPPRVAIVPLDLIDVDRNYQRPIKERLVKKILTEFRWDKFGAISLSEKPDSRFNVTEGQHRWTAACRHPEITAVPAVITDQHDTRTEAQAFMAINTDRVPITIVERYWAGLAAGDEKALAVSKVLRSADCDVVPERGYLRPNLTSAIAAIERCLERYGDGATRKALTIIRAAWPDDAKALRGSLIIALARIVRSYSTIQESELANAIKLESYAQLAAHAETFKNLSGGTPETALTRTIAELYNRGRRINLINISETR